MRVDGHVLPLRAGGRDAPVLPGRDIASPAIKRRESIGPGNQQCVLVDDQVSAGQTQATQFDRLADLLMATLLYGAGLRLLECCNL